VKANDGVVVVVKIDDVVAGVENAKREEAGVDATVDDVVTAGVGAKENGDGAAVVVVEGVANANREPDGATVVAVFVFAGAPASEKRDED
jgi:hypothetical protein